MVILLCVLLIYYGFKDTLKGVSFAISFCASISYQFLYGTDCLPCPDCYNQHPDGSKTRRINVEAAYKLAASTKVPFGILNQANAIWRAEHPSLSYLLVGGVRTVRTYFCTFSNANISASRSFLGNLECAIVFSTLELYG